MKRGTIDKLCEAINTKKGLIYPSVGYLYYANIAGDGRRHRTVYQIIREGGGVAAVHNGYHAKATAANLRAALAMA